MEVTVKLRYLHIAPRKVREVADLIRGKKVEAGQTILEFLIKKPAQPLLKLLKSATSAAKNDFQIDQSNLYISKILVDEGPKLKRWRASSRGRVSPIIKRTSHVTLVLDVIGKPRKIKKVKKEKVKEIEKIEKKPKFKPEKFKPEREAVKPKIKGIKRIFQRKAF